MQPDKDSARDRCRFWAARFPRLSRGLWPLGFRMSRAPGCYSVLSVRPGGYAEWSRDCASVALPSGTHRVLLLRPDVRLLYCPLGLQHSATLANRTRGVSACGWGCGLGGVGASTFMTARRDPRSPKKQPRLPNPIPPGIRSGPVGANAWGFSFESLWTSPAGQA